MQQVVNALEEETFAKGDCIVREGEIGRTFYILQKGEIAVFKKGEEAAGGNGEGGGSADSSMGSQVGLLK